jgi:hypothetical protein
MKSGTLRTLAFLFVAVVALPATAQADVRFADLAGWWSADPVHGGESSHVVLQFREKDGKPEARLWLMAIGAMTSGWVPSRFPATRSIPGECHFRSPGIRSRRRLSGHLPADAAPVYNIPVEFKRSEPIEKPAARDWKAARPKARWSVDTGAPVWAGIERDDETGLLIVGNENGDVNAIDGEGKVRWKFATGKPIRAQPTVLGASVYIVSDSGYLYRLKLNTGAEQWRAKIVSEAPPRLPTNDPKTRWIAMAPAWLPIRNMCTSPAATRICTRWISRPAASCGMCLPTTS